MRLESAQDPDDQALHILESSNFSSKEHLTTQENAGKLAAALHVALAGGDDQELLETLNMIKLCSQTQSGVLPHLSEVISKLTSHDSKNVRNVSYDLFLRLLRLNPNLSRTLSESFVSCLQSNDAAIASHALEKVSYFFIPISFDMSNSRISAS